MSNTPIALVTGGGRGLGKDMAIRLAEAGKDLVITWNSNSEHAKEVAEQIRALGRRALVLPLHMEDPEAPFIFAAALSKALTDHWNVNSIDYVVHNAGMGATIPMTQAKPEDFDRFMQVHFKGVYFLTQQLMPMVNDGGGLVFISSGTTRFSNPGYSMYASMKGAIEVLYRYVAKEYSSKKIRSNVVAPGAIETDFNNATIRNNPQVKQMIASNTPLGRVGQADDIGSVVAFLCSDAAKWVNGQKIEVTGGVFI